MTRAIFLLSLGAAAALTAGGCSCAGESGALADAGVDAMPDAYVPDYQACDAGDEAFVRNAYLAILGHRPLSQAEIDVYVDVLVEARALREVDDSLPDPREVVARALMTRPGYVDRWAGHVMDALRVPRIEDQSMESCYGRADRPQVTDDLARHVRDNPGDTGGDGGGRFTMLDLLRSALVLDDVSVVYRAHLFALVSRPIPGANVPRVQRELARREDFGLVFDSAYLNRDIVCLACHNSEFSVTWHVDPDQNRHFALPGLFEKPLYGSSFGVDPERAHAPFRYDGLVADGSSGDSGDTRPWDWAPACGGFSPGGLPDDPAGVDGLFGGLTGQRLTVYDLEAALLRGVDTITAGGLVRGDGGEIADPDAAFAYLVAASIVESVWREVMGTPLTISNYFARNEAAAEMLLELTERFVASGFSLQALLVDIVSTDYFNRLPPEAGCGAQPYNMPPIFDPWVTGDDDEARRRNSSADAVASLSGRTLLRASYEALEWRRPRFQLFPEVPSEIYYCQQFNCSTQQNICNTQSFCCVSYELICEYQPGPNEPRSFEERDFQLGVGVFLKNGERGFRSLDFQARLVWEDRFGRCRKPTEDPDFLDQIAALAAERGGTVGDVVVAIKDRLVGEPHVSEAAGPAGVSERQAIESMFGAALDAPASTVANLDGRMRSLCGVLMSSPGFLLAGFAPTGGEVPRLTPPAVAYDTVCAAVAGEGLVGALAVTCEGDSLTVTPN